MDGALVPIVVCGVYDGILEGPLQPSLLPQLTLLLGSALAIGTRSRQPMHSPRGLGSSTGPWHWAHVGWPPGSWGSSHCMRSTPFSRSPALRPFAAARGASLAPGEPIGDMLDPSGGLR